MTPGTSDVFAAVEYLDGDGFALADADPVADGHQVDLEVGDNVIGVRVTAQDGIATSNYMVTVSRGEFACAAPPDLSGRIEVWSGTMTVGSSGLYFGYEAGTGAYGALSDTDFGYGGSSYTIEGIARLYGDVGSPDELQLGLDRLFPNDGHRADLLLHVCGETFRLEELDATSDTIDKTYTWSTVTGWPDALYWSDATKVELALSTVRTVDADASLSGLALADDDGGAVALNPPFDPGEAAYAASVVNAVGRVTVTPATSNPFAAVEYLDGAGFALADADTVADGHSRWTWRSAPTLSGCG